ncbi:MAG: SpoIIE family protein phosphatase [Bacteroidetes bacterium]|nr:SpoIIE family protein phosphatase [Bacteroidota bacterium]
MSLQTDTHKPHILCVESNRTEKERLMELLLPYQDAFVIRAVNDGDELLRMLDRLILEGESIGMLLVAQQLSDGKGTHFLAKSYEKWPHSLFMLIAEQPGTVSLEDAEAAHIFRVFYRPLDNLSFGLGMREATSFYLYQQAVNQKAKILTELHRASMNLSGEIHLEKLLHKMMRILIDNADARHGYIIMEEENGNLYIEASGAQGSYDTRLERAEITDFSPVCPAIVDYVRKTRENVILNDALNEGAFATHPYVRKNLCRSLLCAPLIYQGKLYGILYLENNEKTDAFNSESLELFRLLTAPAAIAIQNAKLYSHMESIVDERTREVMAQKEEIERSHNLIRQKNDDIISSINYARRIQDAFLPSIHGIKKAFDNCFVYYKPKDIVSGDFYWFSRRLSKTIIAAADCTGHGIPGAFMTIMANTLLRQIVELEGIFKPDQILYHLNLRVRVALSQDTETSGGNHNYQKDGLDIALLQIDTKRRKLQFAGANRPLIIVKKDGTVEEHKGDKVSIGGYQAEEHVEYTTHNFELDEGDTIYLFSDGYPDQIGEKEDRRFKSKRFHTLLQEIYNKDMDHQRLLLDAELRHWRGDNEQTDDIVVIGIRF